MSAVLLRAPLPVLALVASVGHRRQHAPQGAARVALPLRLGRGCRRRLPGPKTALPTTVETAARLYGGRHNALHGDNHRSVHVGQPIIVCRHKPLVSGLHRGTAVQQGTK